MFNIQNKQLHIIGLYDIVANYCCLINDGNNDILFTGTNKFSSRILGSILFEDDENLYLRYIHTIITDDEFYCFINKQTSLRDIISKCNSIFIVDKDYNHNTINSALIPFEDLPEEYLPLSNSYCPSFVKKNSLDYTFSLKGDLADIHKAEPLIMSDTNAKVFSLLSSTSNFLEGIRIKPIIYSEVAMAGSFELNFEIELKEELNLFSQSQEDIKLFYYKFLNYIFEKLPNEPDNVIKHVEETSEHLKELFAQIKQIYTSRNVAINDESAEQKIIDLITYSVDTIKDLQYKGYNRIEVGNKLANGDKLPVGLIETDFYNSVANKIFKPEELEKPDLIELDDTPTDYKIQVFSLNRETGNGGAYIIIDENVAKIKLHLRGREDYHGTVFTKSLDDSLSIEIKGIGKRVNKEIKEVTVNL
jgi:hypothetical protein